MEKHRFLVCFGMALFLMIFSFALANANTLVGGKIYNSDFSDVIEGADVSVQCGLDVLDSVSLIDGTYAVTFDTDSCYNSDSVEVTASKGNLHGKETSIINNSTEGEGEFVAVANVNIKSKEDTGSTTTTSSGGGGSGRYYMCGNGICDSGETSQTCLMDCPLTDEEENESQSGLLDLSSNSGNSGDSLPSEGNQNSGNPLNLLGLTGAVTGVFGEKTNFIFIILGLVLLLILAIIVIALVRK